GSLPIAQRSPKILNSSPALPRSVWRFFLLPIRPPKSTKSAPCTLTPAQPKSGFARWTVPSPFLFLLTINYLFLPFARPSPAASRDPPTRLQDLSSMRSRCARDRPDFARTPATSTTRNESSGLPAPFDPF